MRRILSAVAITVALVAAPVAAAAPAAAALPAAPAAVAGTTTERTSTLADIWHYAGTYDSLLACAISGGAGVMADMWDDWECYEQGGGYYTLVVLNPR
ncbi:hypothetical protein [Couchioplanes caeruleus]|uniref:Secreted protein n=2 Tax=Couchioplanes caeruleus TaxID=56438 RepID=A0A1K0FG29_9ACTN|nr:hypothetical protein [Couchioplanes caeruleus]OJF11799.1 hypothetical protein BG844_24250 [Couchioplanes caeruleus subsp. caeruleus]